MRTVNQYGYSGLYGGDIKTMSWTANGSSHSYTFGYDGVGRMMNANTAQAPTASW